MEIGLSVLTEHQLQNFAFAIAELVLLGGFVGGFLWALFCDVLRALFRVIDRRAAKRERIFNARWRAHWNRALREARECGYTGRRAIAFAVNTMKTRREAIAEIGLHG